MNPTRALEQRATVHAALGDPHRLQISDALVTGDLTVAELAAVTGLSGNALAYHLNVLEAAGLVERRVSAGDHRRRYVVLRRPTPPCLEPGPSTDARSVLFVCTHNSARSQFAAAYWRRRTGRRAESAGADPASRVDPRAVAAAADHDLDLSAETPKGYDEVRMRPDLVVSVCDRALESGIPFEVRHLHWSIPDPVVAGGVPAFRRAFGEIAARIDVLVGQAPS